MGALWSGRSGRRSRAETDKPINPARTRTSSTSVSPPRATDPWSKSSGGPSKARSRDSRFRPGSAALIFPSSLSWSIGVRPGVHPELRPEVEAKVGGWAAPAASDKGWACVAPLEASEASDVSGASGRSGEPALEAGTTQLPSLEADKPPSWPEASWPGALKSWEAKAPRHGVLADSSKPRFSSLARLVGGSPAAAGTPFKSLRSQPGSMLLPMPTPNPPVKPHALSAGCIRSSLRSHFLPRPMDSSRLKSSTPWRTISNRDIMGGAAVGECARGEARGESDGRVDVGWRTPGSNTPPPDSRARPSPCPVGGPAR
mmetsp:Transcript_52077/g.118689  ORF Transcript_52077/g.118689 Transcript_52077/m.118689 type:complete len:315 (+) Transcript_52077:1510-2454(+)